MTARYGPWVLRPSTIAVTTEFERPVTRPISATGTFGRVPDVSHTRPAQPREDQGLLIPASPHTSARTSHHDSHHDSPRPVCVGPPRGRRHRMGHLLAGQPAHSVLRAARRSRRAQSTVVMKHRKAANVPYPQRASPRAPRPPSNPPPRSLRRKGRGPRLQSKPLPRARSTQLTRPQEALRFNCAQRASARARAPASSPSHAPRHIHRCPPEHPRDAPPDAPLPPPLRPPLPHRRRRPRRRLARRPHPLHPGIRHRRPQKGAHALRASASLLISLQRYIGGAPSNMAILGKPPRRVEISQSDGGVRPHAHSELDRRRARLCHALIFTASSHVLPMAIFPVILIGMENTGGASFHSIATNRDVASLTRDKTSRSL